MSEAKHTREPWAAFFYEKERTWGVRNLLFAVANCVEQGDEEDEANAHLIAAAPDLLAALRLARGYVLEYACGKLDDPRIVRIDAAIAKATNATT